MVEMLKSVDPATGEVVGEVAVTPCAEIPAVVARARRAQAAWGALGPEGRRDALLPAAELLAARAEDIGRLVTHEMGKPLKEAVGEARACADLADLLEEMAEALAPEVRENEHARSTVHHDPFGVAAAIAPWNFPVLMPHWLAVPSLMAGNTVVLKPSEETPLTGQAYADALIEVLPDDVLQVIHGADAQGRALVAADVDLIAFTGSREVGKAVLEVASKSLKRVVLELGGKDPLIVLDDADVAAAAAFAARNSFRNAGQVCVSTERIYVDRRVADAFLEALVAETSKMTVGGGFDEETRVGPMVSERQRDHVLAQVEDALSRGARLVAGGEGHHGNFVMPTVLADVTPEMDIARRETFGPVACVTTVGDEEEAVRLANDTPFGLGAVVFGEDTRARRVARRLTAGMIGVNRGVGGVGTPWVGARESGYGFHGSPEGHRQFAQTRVVTVSK